jgi:trehalose 6-phosphate phosphatase
VRTLLGERKYAAALYVGDDTPDLDAFRALRELVQEGVVDRAICAGVSSEDGPPAIEEDADVVVAGTEGVRELLSALIAE